MSDPIQDYIDEIEGEGGLTQGKKGSAATGPRPDFDFTLQQQQVQKAYTFVEEDMLKAIDSQLETARREIDRTVSRVSPTQGRTQSGVKKAIDYETNLIKTERFLAGEREAIAKSLEEKKKLMGESYEVTAENKLTKSRTIEGPPKPSRKPIGYEIKGPLLTPESPYAEVPRIKTEVNLPSGQTGTIKVDPNIKGSATIIGTEPAPSPQAEAKAKSLRKTATSQITVTTEPKVSPGGIEYRSPKQTNVPELRIGTTPEGKPIKGQTPAFEYLSERGLKSDIAITKAQAEQGADYAAKIAQEQISQYKLEFDFETGTTSQTTLESVMGTKPKYEDTMTASEKRELYRSQVKPATTTTGLDVDYGKPFEVKQPTTKGGQSAGFGDAGKIPDLRKPSIFTVGPLIKGLHRTFKGKAYGFGVLPKKSIEEILGKVPGSQYSKRPEA
jgi:hypothetical protein